MAWQFDKAWTIEEFIDRNIKIYCDKYLEDYPQNAHMINDGDLEHMMEWINMDDVIEQMTHFYHQELFNDVIKQKTIKLLNY